MASPTSFTLFLSALFLLVLSTSSAEEPNVSAPPAPSHVLTLRGSNFSENVSKHPFIVVKFHAPWCGACKMLEPEYEKAAATLSGSHDPPIVLAEVDITDESNRELTKEYQVTAYPTLFILRNGGETKQEYKGPRHADGIVQYLKRQTGPASQEIESAEDAGSIIDKNKVVIAGIFSEFSGKKYDSFIKVAEKLRGDFDFVHTLEPAFLPAGGQSKEKRPFIRLLKPFDELFVDFTDFQPDVLEKFIDESSTPLVTIYDEDPHNHAYVTKYFKSDNAKAMVFLNFSTSENLEEFRSKYHDAAEKYKGRNISFLLSAVDNNPTVLKYFGIKKEQLPVIVILTSDAKYIKTNLEPGHIAVWLKDYMDGKVQAYVKSEPIPKVNNGHVKVVVADNFNDVVYNSGKNVLIEFSDSSYEDKKEIAQTLDEIAIHFENDTNVMIVTMDATSNDVPTGFDVDTFPTMYFLSASGVLVQYEGNGTKEDLIEFIQKNRSPIANPELNRHSSTEAEHVEDEL